MKSKYIVVTAILLGLIVSFVGWDFYKNNSTNTIIENSNNHGNPAADFTDNRNLVGVATHVFLAKVELNKGQLEESDTPITQFDVKVLNTIKGEFEGKNIVVNQKGGYYTENGKKYLEIFNDDPLLIEGEIYLLSAIEQKDGSMLIIPKYGNIKVGDKASQETLVQEFKEAYKNQRILK
jgi:hypothetical protein